MRRREIDAGVAAADVSAGRSDDRARMLRAFVADAALREALEYFCQLAERGPPLLASGLAIASRQAVLWREVYEANLPGLESFHYRLAEALENVERAGRYAVSGGGFARFVASDAPISPELVLGAQRRRARQVPPIGLLSTCRPP